MYRSHFHVCLGVVLLIGCAAKPTISNTQEAVQLLEDQQLLPINGEVDKGGTLTCINDAPHRKPCDPALKAPDYFSKHAKEIYNIEHVDQARAITGSSEPIGLALAGGGQKAASYSVGVLRGLHGIVGAYDAATPHSDSIASEIGAISSVSGGSYAALWYFSNVSAAFNRELREDAIGEHTRSVDAIFLDCLPRDYCQYVGSASECSECALKGEGEQTKPDSLCPAEQNNFVNAEESSGLRRDRFRHQNQLRGFSDLFSKNWDYGRKPRAYTQLAKEILVTIPTIPFNLLTKFVVNWRDLRTSISASRYLRSIERTYGLQPSLLKHASEAAGQRYSPNTNAGRGLTMESLANVYLTARYLRRHAKSIHASTPASTAASLPHVPLWIANTTAQVDKSNVADIEDRVFQFTPFRYGSRHFGHWKGSPRRVDISQVTGASAAFVDAQWARGIRGMLIGLGLSALNARWSYMLPNPIWQDSVRTQHKFLPFPFWLAHYSQPGVRGAWIRLSDGGMSENLAAFALIQRGYRELVIADNGRDDGRLEDVCLLKQNLKHRKLYLYFPHLGDFEQACAGTKRANLWNWQHPVQLGCITRNEVDRDCSASGDPDYFARLYLLKPALSKSLSCLARAAASKPFPGCEPEVRSCPNAQAPTDFYACARIANPGLPPELFGFLVNNVSIEPRNPSDPFLFPQHSTFWITLNSSPFVFGAYRELGAWQAAHIKPIRACLAKGRPALECMHLRLTAELASQ
jgi:hypothetical protein